MLIEAGCEGLTVEQCRLAAPGSAGTLSRSSFVAKSSFVVEPLGASAVSALLTAVEDLDTSMPGTGGGVVFDSYGGVIGDIAPTANRLRPPAGHRLRPVLHRLRVAHALAEHRGDGSGLAGAGGRP